MKLYDYQPAPSPRRVRIFAAEKNLSIPTVQIDLAKREQFESEFAAKNPGFTVPALELDDGTVISESMAICRYLEALYPDPPLFGTDARSKGLVEMWVRIIEYNGYAAVADMLRNSSEHFADRGLTGAAGGIPQVPALVERGRATLERFFDRLEDQLAQNQYIAGNSFTVADITALVVTDFARWVKQQPRDDHKHIAAWYQRIAARPSAKA